MCPLLLTQEDSYSLSFFPAGLKRYECTACFFPNEGSIYSKWMDKTLTFWSSGKSVGYNDNSDFNRISSLKQTTGKKKKSHFAEERVTFQSHVGDCSSGTMVIIEIGSCDLPVLFSTFTAWLFNLSGTLPAVGRKYLYHLNPTPLFPISRTAFLLTR